MPSLWEVLKTSKGLPAPDGFTALFAHSLSDTYTLAEISGIPPLNLGEIVEIVDYTIYGNIYQSDGVSPDTPQEVVGVGERTGNLFDISTIEAGRIDDTGVVGYVPQTSLTVSDSTITFSTTSTWRGFVSDYIEINGVKPILSYGSFTSNENATLKGLFFYYDADKQYLGNTSEYLANAKYTRISFQTDVIVTNAVVSNIMLNEGSTPLPYEPYGYKVDVVSRGKNLFDGWNVSKTFLGLTCKTSENMTIVLNGTKIDGLNVQSITSPNILLKAGTYTVSIKMISGSIEGITDGVYFGINRNTYDRRTAPGLLKIGDIGKRTFTLTEDTTLSSFDIAPSYGSPGAIFTNATFECQFEYGDTATSYESYHEPITAPLYLDSPLYKIGDYSDSIGMAEEVRAIKELVLTGKEAWSFSTLDSKNRAYMTDWRSALGNSLPLCTHYAGISGGGSYPSEGKCLINSNGTPIFNADFVSDKTEWKSYLAAQYANGTPVTVYYVLAKPKTKAVSPVEILTIQGTNIIDINTEVKPSNLKITYKSKM